MDVKHWSLFHNLLNMGFLEDSNSELLVPQNLVYLHDQTNVQDTTFNISRKTLTLCCKM